jgi:threonine synthase
MRAQARLMCAEGCAGEFTPATTLYRCPRCAGLLEVRHELAALPEAAVWREIVRTRTFGGEWPHLSGVWRLHEWVMPWVRREHVVSLGEGGSPLVPAGRYGAAIGARSLWIKQCGSGHTGSFKDLGMTVLVSAVKQIIAEGREIRAMVCASTGDTSAALAAYGAAAGIPVIVLLPAGKISSAQLLQPRAHGAMVVALEADFDGCMRVVERLAAEPTLYLANSLNCLRIEGQKTIAWEIVAQRGGVVPAWVLVPGGNLGNVSALAKGFLELLALGWIDRLPRLVCCQAERAAPLYEAFLRAKAAGRALRSEDYRPVQAGTTAASAIQIGAPVSLPKAVAGLNACGGLVAAASEAALAAAAALADQAGFYVCPQTAAALACAEQLVADRTIGAEEEVVVISTAHGLKFGEFKAQVAAENQAVRVSREPEAAVAAIHRLLDARR